MAIVNHAIDTFSTKTPGSLAGQLSDAANWFSSGDTVAAYTWAKDTTGGDGADIVVTPEKRVASLSNLVCAYLTDFAFTSKVQWDVEGDILWADNGNLCGVGINVGAGDGFYALIGSGDFNEILISDYSGGGRNDVATFRYTPSGIGLRAGQTVRLKLAGRLGVLYAFADGKFVGSYDHGNPALFTLFANVRPAIMIQGASRYPMSHQVQYFQATSGTTALAKNWTTARVPAPAAQVQIQVHRAFGGTPPISYKIHRSTDRSFTPGAGNLLGTCDANLRYIDTSPPAGISYYKPVATDSAGSPVSVTHPLVAVVPNSKRVLLFGIADSIFGYALGNLSGQVLKAAGLSSYLKEVETPFQVFAESVAQFGIDVANYVNMGIGGSQSSAWVPGQANLTNANARFATYQAAYSDADPWAIIALGINDSFPGVERTAAAYVANISLICADQIALGRKCLVIPPHYVRIFEGFAGWWNETSDALMEEYETALAGLENGTTIRYLGFSTRRLTANQLVDLPDGPHPYPRLARSLGVYWAAGFARAASFEHGVGEGDYSIMAEEDQFRLMLFSSLRS